MTELNVEARPVLRRLEFKLAVAIWLLVGIGLLVLGAIDAVAARRQAFDLIGLAQHARASEVRWAVTASIDTVRSQVRALAALPWEVTGWLGIDERRLEYQRILRMFPSIDRIALIERGGPTLLVVSRREPDGGSHLLHSRNFNEDIPVGRVSGNAVFYANDFEPMLRLVIADEGINQNETLVDINLGRLAGQMRQAIPAFEAGAAYVTDDRGTVVLHRDASVMVRRLSLAARSDVIMGDVERDGTAEGRGLDGRRVLASSTAIESLPLRVYVEQPLDEAVKPAWAVVHRAVGLTVLWMAVVAGFGWYAARRISRPIRQLADGAASLAKGNLATRIELQTNDEVGELAQRFNLMASTLQDTITHQEQRIAEKTQALERANRNKTEFLANMSHELRTPLQAVIGFAESLRDYQEHYGPLTPKQDHYVREIHGSGAHLLSLINDLLDLNKVEAGQMEFAVGDCDIAAVVERSLMFVRQAALGRGLALRVAIEPADLLWRADPRRLKQILTNLLANAVKFTETGSIAVDARVVGEELWIEVRDTGRGIAPEDLPHLCEPFRQLPGATGATEDRAIEGTGLGLALVRQLAQLHGGSLEWESELGVGSMFRVRLPKEPGP